MTRPDPTTLPHADHDRLLVAAYVAGDLGDADLGRARALLDGCVECRTLATEIGALSATLRALPAPVRPRDFRITSAQAEAIERRGLRRFLPASRPSLAFARPLGAALTTVGVAGLLFAAVLGGSPVMRILSNVGNAVGPAGGADYGAAEQAGGSGSQGSGSKGGIAAPSAAASGASSPVASPASAQASGRDASLPGTPAPSGPPVPMASSPSPIPPAASVPPASPAGASPAGASPAGASPAGASPSPATGQTGSLKPEAATGSGGGLPLLPAASVAALLGGLGLLGADRLLRRR